MKRILYTHDDNDGLLSALLVALKVKELEDKSSFNAVFDNLEIKELGYGNYEEILKRDIESGKLDDNEVTFTDFCPKIEHLREIEKRAICVNVYDHHRLPKEILELEYVHHDVNESGCSLVWRELFGGEIPLLIKEGRNRDLFQKNPNTDYYYLAINAIKGLSTDIYSQIKALTPYLNSVKAMELKKIGEQLMPIYKNMLPLDKIIVVGKYGLVESPAPQVASDTAWYGQRDYKLDFFMLWYKLPNGYGYGLRTSTDNKRMIEFAKLNGGGGHYQACGFTSTKNPKKIFEEFIKFMER